MTFQRRTAGRLIQLVRALKPGVKIVVGGYDPSLAGEAYEGMGVDYIVRGEGEFAFRELLRALERGKSFDRICGLSLRNGEVWLHNPNSSVHRLEGGDLRPPDRSARVLSGYTLLGRQVDVVETSRGCTYDCSFCSIIEMRAVAFTLTLWNASWPTSAMPAIAEPGQSSWSTTMSRSTCAGSKSSATPSSTRV